MTSRTSGMAIAAFVVALGAGAGAHAQATGTTGTVGTSGSVGVGNSGVSGGVSASASGGQAGAGKSGKPIVPLSAADQQAAAEQIVQRASRLSERLTLLLDEARREADMIRVTCLNDKLTQVNANLRTAQSRYGTLQKTVDQEQRTHEFTVISVLGQKFQVLEQQANACVGQDLYETGPTKVVTELDTTLLPFENDPGSPPMMLPTAPMIPFDMPPVSTNGT